MSSEHYRLGPPLGTEERQGDPAFAGPIALRRVRVSGEGRDGLGTYWGPGLPLYCFGDEAQTINGSVRAADRATARAFVLAKYPNAKVDVGRG